jgi:elongation factor P
MPSANDLRKGMAIKHNSDVCVVLDMQHRTPGNLRAFVQATLRSIKTGKSAVVRFSSTEPIEVVNTHTRRIEFSYKDHNGFHFMDPETYDTITLHEEFIADNAKYLTENLSVTLMEVEGKPAEIELPPKVRLKVVEAPPGVRGDTASNVTKPAKVENGFEVGVPLFINPGDLIEVDTRTGKYLNRVSQ